MRNLGRRSGTAALTIVLAGVALLASGSSQGLQRAGMISRADKSDPPPAGIDDVARGYVFAVLRFDRIREGNNDYYYGPAAWKEAVAAEPKPEPARLLDAVKRLGGWLEAHPSAKGADGLVRERHLWLRAQLTALESDLQMMVSGRRLPVRAQVEKLFQLEARYTPESELAQTHAALDALLPGEGDLSSRIAAFRNSFTVPKEKVDAVYRFALEEVRRRTREFLPLPDGEGVDLGFVTGKSWGGYNYFQGNSRSNIDINLDLPVQATGVFRYVAHEAYPGHHTELALREARLYRDAGMVEWCVSPLFTPKNAVSEAIAEVGTEILFTKDGLHRWMKEVLWPKFDLPGDLDRWRRLDPLLEKLSDARDNVPFLLYDRGKSDDEAIAYLVREQGVDRDRAAKSVAFDREWGVYTFNYRTGRNLLRRYVHGEADAEAGAGTEAELRARRERFVRLLTHPVTPRIVRDWIARQ